MESKPLDNSNKDTLYSNFHVKVKQSPAKRARLKTDQGSLNFDLMTPSISRYRNNFSLNTKKGSFKDRTMSSLDY